MTTNIVSKNIVYALTIYNALNAVKVMHSISVKTQITILFQFSSVMTYTKIDCIIGLSEGHE
jgi:hypothetical protein